MRIYRVTWVAYADEERTAVWHRDDYRDGATLPKTTALITEDQITEAGRYGDGLATVEFVGTLVEFPKEAND